MYSKAPRICRSIGAKRKFLRLNRKPILGWHRVLGVRTGALGTADVEIQIGSVMFQGERPRIRTNPKGLAIRRSRESQTITQGQTPEPEGLQGSRKRKDD